MLKQGTRYVIPLILIMLIAGLAIPASIGNKPEVQGRIANPPIPVEQLNPPLDAEEDFANPPGTDWGVLFSENATARDIVDTGDGYAIAGYG